ncbi:MAG TPA: pyridoxal phosphate-dependent aminotransferase [Thermoanaerobaculia bacterium]|nr:pyridoxal phosphate-dependent aminotransferase [Thermoanaerobaculia bacterium]HQR67608.1 pyridoxal phosphate-dependent aminotransferase [Thermoanaerobaculia bacterium]
MTTTLRATPKVSRRGEVMPPSPIRKLMPLANEAKARGVKVLHLNIGQPDLETPEPMRRRLTQLKETVYAYSPSNGTPEYLDFLLAYYGRLGLALERDQILATTGGSEALLFAFMACADPGGEILTVEPFYTNYRSFAAMAGLTLHPIVTRGEDGFHLPGRAAWEKGLTPGTRVVLLCNPNNPTGTVYAREELLVAAEFCRDHGLFFICDEVYREFLYDGRASVSALSLDGYESQVVVVDSLSKRFSACGIRLGALVTRNRDVAGACNRMAQGRLSPPGLAQFIAPGALELGPDYYRSVVTEYQKRRDTLYEGLSRLPGVFLRKPEGAFYFVARLPIDDCDDFAAWLLTDFQLAGRTVMVAPASGFYVTPGLGKNEVRIAYVLRDEELHLAVEVLAAALPAYRKARNLG